MTESWLLKTKADYGTINNNMKNEQLVRKIGVFLVYLLPLTLLLFYKQSMFPFLSVKSYAFCFLSGALLAVIGYLAIFSKEFNFCLGKTHKAILIFLGTLTLSGLFGLNPFQSFFGTLDRGIGIFSIFSFYIYYLGIIVLLKKENISKYLKYLLGVSILVALFALLQRVAPGIFYLADGIRPGGTLGNPIFLAGYLLSFIFLAYSFLLDSAKNSKIIYALTGTLLLIVFFGANTRGAILGIVLGVIFLLSDFFRESIKSGNAKKSLIAVVISVLVFSGILFTTKEASLWQKVPVINRIVSFSTSDTSIINRLIGWKVALKGFTTAPILGVGYENFRSVADSEYDPRQLRGSFSETFFDKPHNAVLEVLATGGIVGIIAYAYLLLSIWRGIGATSLDKKYKNIAKATLLAYFIQDLFIFDTFGTFLNLFIGLALLTIMEKQEEPAKTIKVSYEKIFGWLFFPVAGLFIVYSAFIFSGNLNHYQMMNNFAQDEARTAFEFYQEAKANKFYPFKTQLTQDALTSIAQQSQLLQVPTALRYIVPVFADSDLILEKEPNNYPFLITYAETKTIVTRFKKSYLDGIDQMIEKAMQLAPMRQQNYYTLSRSKIVRDDLPGALEAMQKAIDLDPLAGDPHFQYGLIAYQKGDKKTALIEFEKAISLGYSTGDLRELEMLGDYFGDAEKYDFSYQMLSKAYEISPNVELLAKLGVVSYYGGNYELAKMHFEKLIKESPNLKESPNYPVLEGMFNDVGIVQ
jgi:O-antigen ligase